MKIYTKTGDGGETGLRGGSRVPKDNIRVIAYGEVDELNSQIGLAIAQAERDFADTMSMMKLKSILESIQNELFVVGADLASPVNYKDQKVGDIAPVTVKALEHIIDSFDEELEPLTQFILPSGGLTATQLHVCRSRCRAAERACVTLARNEPISSDIVPYLNRLSDLCFVLARWVAKINNRPELPWDKTRKTGN